MQLSDKQIKDLIECWKKDFGEVLSQKEARVEAVRLLDFFQKFAEGLTRIRQRVTEPPAQPPIT
jgi:archaellum biogenesis protein FlaJ (TadC family)